MPRRAAHRRPAPAEPEAAARDEDGPLTDAYRPIRAIAPPETPIGGVLSRVGEDTVVLVDTRELAAWPGWGFTDAQHVLGPLDVARRAGGHDAVLPWCSERVDVFLGRRRAASAPLSGGEVVTLVVSSLRGTAEAHTGRDGDQPSPVGAWWLTDAGRPVFVHDGVGDAVEGGARRMLEEIASGCGDRHLHRLLVAAAGALDKPRSLPTGVARLEAELFDACAPQPLSTAIFPSARSRDLDVPALGPFGAVEGPAESPRVLRDTIARHVDGGLADVVSVAIGEAVRTLRTRLGRGRRAPWVAAAGVAGAIILGGALWPAGGGAEPVAHAADPAPADPTEVAADPDSPPPATAEETAGELAALPLDAEAGLLLERLAACRRGSEPSCLDDVLESPSIDPPRGAIDLDDTARSTTLLDDYGGVAVLRVDALAGDATPQLIVIVREDDGWLLRDVYDVAEQPSE